MDVAIPSYRVVAVHPREAEQEGGPGADAGTKRLTARESRKTVTLVFADPKPTSLTSEPPSAEALRDVMVSDTAKRPAPLIPATASAYGSSVSSQVLISMSLRMPASAAPSSSRGTTMKGSAPARRTRSVSRSSGIAA